MGCPPRGVGLSYTATVLLLSVLWFFLYVFSCRRIFLVGSSLSHNSFSVKSCHFGVPMRGSGLRVFLLCHLGNSLLQYFLIFLKSNSYSCNMALLHYSFQSHILCYSTKSHKTEDCTTLQIAYRDLAVPGKEVFFIWLKECCFLEKNFALPLISTSM